jgi:inhibitor of KinA
MDPLITPLGDNGITVTFGTAIDIQTNERVLSLFNYLQQQNLEYVKDVIPAYASLSVIYDVTNVREVSEGSAYTYVHTQVEQAIRSAQNIELTAPKTLHIPVCYDVSLGTDLEKISQQKHLSIEEIIDIHSSKTYRVYMIGFLPGFAYMGDVDESIATPRKTVPAQNILAGSVGIADAQTGIYPFNSPGGWNIIGQTPELLFYPDLAQPCLFQPGDNVQFIPITLSDFNILKKEA